MTTPDFRALCAELADDLELLFAYGGIHPSQESDDLIDRARAALAEPDHFVDVPKMVEPAEGEVAELVKWLRETGQQGLDSGLLFAEQNGRQLTHAADLLSRLAPQPVPEGPTDDDLLELMPQQFRDDLATVSRLAAHGTSPDVTPGIFRVSLNTGALDFARAALACWGQP